MSTINDSDLFLVQRSQTTFKTQAKDLMSTIQDTDLMLINRSGQSYKVTCADVKEQLGGGGLDPRPEDITVTPSFQGGTGTDVDPFILATKTLRPAGATTSSDEFITITVPGAEVGTTVTWTDNSIGAGDRFAQPSGTVAADGTWSGRLVYNDTPDTTVDQDYVGKLQIGIVHFQWTIEQKVSSDMPPEFNGVTLTELSPGGNRFTSQSFNVSFGMKADGIPASSKQVKVYAEGSLKVKPVSPPITGVTDTANGKVQDPNSNWTRIARFGSGTTANFDFNQRHILRAVSPNYVYHQSYPPKAADSGNGPWNNTLIGDSGGTCVVAMRTYNDEAMCLVGPKNAIVAHFSTDGGQTWERKGTIFGSETAGALAWCGGRWIAAIGTSIWFSTNGGTTWSERSGVLGSNYTQKLVTKKFQDNDLTVLRWTSNTFEYSSDGGITWTITPSSQASVTGDPAADMKDISWSASENCFFAIHNNVNTSQNAVKKSTTGASGSWTVVSDTFSNFSASYPTEVLGIDGHLIFPTYDSKYVIYKLDGSKGWQRNSFFRVNPSSTMNQNQMIFAVGKAVTIMSQSTGDTYTASTRTSQLSFSSPYDTNAFSKNATIYGPAGLLGYNVTEGNAYLMEIEGSSGNWSPYTSQTVTTDEQVVANSRLYAVVDSSGQVSDMQQSEPNFVQYGTGYDFNISFPATFPTGNTPDADLPAGTTLTVIGKAVNDSGNDTATSNTITPS